MSRKTRAIGALMLATAATLGSTLPAHADDGLVQKSSLQSSNGGYAFGKATLDFTGASTIYFSDYYVDDRCNASGAGDGEGAYVRSVVVHMDGTKGHGAWHADTRGCGDGALNIGNGLYTSTKRIKSGGIQVCRGDAGDIKWASCQEDLRDNPHT